MKWDNHADDPVISIVRDFFDAIGLPPAGPCSSAPGEGEFFSPVEWAGILKEPAQVMPPMLKRHG